MTALVERLKQAVYMMNNPVERGWVKAWEELVNAASELISDHTAQAAALAAKEAAIAKLRLGHNAFLGEVQTRLYESGLEPPAWPDTIRDQGDTDSALDSCVLWCGDRLGEIATLEARLARIRAALAPLREKLEAIKAEQDTHRIVDVRMHDALTLLDAAGEE